MDKEMLTCFPNGSIRALLVDDDRQFLNSVTIALSSLHYNVATCRSPTSAVKLLSTGKVKDLDVILADAHKVASCGFNLRTIVENDLRIPVIYFMSLEAPPPPAGDEADKLAATVQSSTFVIKKPLDMSEATNLWKVVAWHKCKLNAERAGGPGGCYRGRDDIAAAVAGGQGNSRSPPLAGHDDHDPGTEENHVYFKVVRARGWRRDNHAGAGGSQRRTVEQMNVTAGIRRHHIGSMPCPLEEYHRVKLQKKNANCSTSSHIDLPTCNTRSNIPRTYADDNASGSRTNATTSGSDDVPTLFPLWPHVFQGQAGNNAGIANIAAPAAVASAPLEHQQPATIDGPSNVDLATHFTYRSAQVAATPVPERRSSANAMAVISDACPALRGDDSHLVASTLNLGAAPSEAALELLLNISKPLMVPAREAASTQPCSKTSASAAALLVAPSQFPVAAAVIEDENETAAAMVAELVAAPDNGGPAAAAPHGQDDEQLQTTAGDWTFSLEDLQGLDIPGDMKGGANTVDIAPLSFLKGDDGIENWGLLTDQDFFHLDDIMDDTDDDITFK